MSGPDKPSGIVCGLKGDDAATMRDWIADELAREAKAKTPITRELPDKDELFRPDTERPRPAPFLSAALKIGDRVPMPPKPTIRPAFTGAGTTSFKPARKHKR